MSVADNFRAFRGAYLIPATTVSSISLRYRRLTRQLNKDFWNSESETAHSLYVGSYGRDTASRGVSDLDVAFTLPNALYHQYHAHLGNGQSALLQAVRTSIGRTYANSYVGADGQVVALDFTDGIRFEILPVFVNSKKCLHFCRYQRRWKLARVRPAQRNERLCNARFRHRERKPESGLPHGSDLARSPFCPHEWNAGRHARLPIHRELGTLR